MRIPMLMAAVVAVSCTTSMRRGADRAVANVLISDEQGRQLGRLVHQRLEEQGVTFVSSPQVDDYVGSLILKMVPSVNADRVVGWRYYLIDDPHELNAFSTPDGRLYLTTGMLMALDNEAQLVALLGHEMAHVVARHTDQQLVDAFGLDTLAEMAVGNAQEKVSRIAEALVKKGAFETFSYQMEYEADERAARYTNAAGDDPHALPQFLQLLSDRSTTPAWLSSHPSNPPRVDHILGYIAQQDLNATELGTDSLNRIKRLLAPGAVGAR